ncbi:MAG: hypothetical protein Q9M31_00980, partial [Mariprofundus sp.]|nr:hypothetical protein [Mariprofundus sp.]
ISMLETPIYSNATIECLCLVIDMAELHGQSAKCTNANPRILTNTSALLSRSAIEMQLLMIRAAEIINYPILLVYKPLFCVKESANF